jgi:hypothetical protein
MQCSEIRNVSRGDSSAMPPSMVEIQNTKPYLTMVGVVVGISGITIPYHKIPWYSTDLY